MAEILRWNGDDYECEYDGSTLYVRGDAWAEARLERARGFYQERHPELSEDEVLDHLAEGDTESEECFQQATDELLDPAEWAGIAVTVDKDSEPLAPTAYSFDAWIKERS